MSEQRVTPEVPGKRELDERKALAWAGAAIVIWGSLAAVVGDALSGVAATTLVLWAFIFASPTLIVVDLLRKKTLRQILTAPPRVVLIGLWGIFGYHAMFFVALEQAPLIEANLLNYLWPLFMVVLAPVLAKEKLRAVDVGSAVFGFAGAALVVTQGKSLHLEPRHAVGYALAATAAFAWSSFSLLLKRLGKEGEDRMAVFSVASIVPALALALATGGIAPPSGRALLAAAWLGAGPMGIAFFCWSRAISLGSAARIGALSYLDPLLSTLAVAAFLSKPITKESWAGMALIVGAAAGPPLVRAFILKKEGPA